ncbi:unnamed protein product [Symbiodinium sp. CCMP2592]|nr:unnamed protein product [Symbiodinium sp. CCMP2592]
MARASLDCQLETHDAALLLHTRTAGARWTHPCYMTLQQAVIFSHLSTERMLHFQVHDGSLIVQVIGNQRGPRVQHDTSGWHRLVQGEPILNAFCQQVEIPGIYVKGFELVARHLDSAVIVLASSVAAGEDWVTVISGLLTAQKGPQRVRRPGLANHDREYCSVFGFQPLTNSPHLSLLLEPVDGIAGGSTLPLALGKLARAILPMTMEPGILLSDAVWLITDTAEVPSSYPHARHTLPHILNRTPWRHGEKHAVLFAPITPDTSLTECELVSVAATLQTAPAQGCADAFPSLRLSQAGPLRNLATSREYGVRRMRFGRTCTTASMGDHGYRRYENRLRLDAAFLDDWAAEVVPLLLAQLALLPPDTLAMLPPPVPIYAFRYRPSAFVGAGGKEHHLRDLDDLQALPTLGQPPLGLVGVQPHGAGMWLAASDATLLDAHFGLVGGFRLAATEDCRGERNTSLPVENRPVRVKCTGASAYNIPARTDEWQLVCSLQCYGPTGCQAEDTTVSEKGQLLVTEPDRLAFAGQHTSLLLAPYCIVQTAYSMLDAPPELAALRRPFDPLIVEGFSAGSYTGAVLATLAHRVWGRIPPQPGPSNSAASRERQFQHTVRLGALGMPDFIFEQLLGLPVRLWLLHAADDQLCPFRSDARSRDQWNADLRRGAGGLVWLLGGSTTALFGSTCHGYGHLLGRVQDLPPELNVAWGKAYLPLINDQEELPLAFQQLHLFRFPVFNDTPHTRTMQALFPDGALTAELLDDIQAVLPADLHSELRAQAPPDGRQYTD